MRIFMANQKPLQKEGTIRIRQNASGTRGYFHFRVNSNVIAPGYSVGDENFPMFVSFFSPCAFHCDKKITHDSGHVFFKKTCFLNVRRYVCGKKYLNSRIEF